MQTAIGLGGRRRWPAVLARACVALLLAATMSFVAASGARAADGCASDSAPGGHPVRLLVDGHKRYVLVHVPRGLSAGRRAPLVLALHGAGGTGPRMEHYSGLSHAADEHEFVVAYPDSTGPVWNLTASRAEADDVAFLDDLIINLQQTMCVDSHRIFAVGVSNGAGMVGLLACQLSSRITGIAAVAGLYPGRPGCHPKQPVSVLEVHGTADPVAPYLGPGSNAAAPGVPPFIKGWVHRDHCQRAASTQQIASRALLYRWNGCAGGAHVEHIRISGGTHQWPGALPPDPGPSATICAACEIWSFFSGLSLGGTGPQSGGVGVSG